MRTVPPTEKGKYRAIASGAIANGKPVIVNTDGTVSVSATTATQAVGSNVVYNTGESTETSTAFDSTNNKVVIAYTDQGNSNYGTAIVGTVDSSDNSISFGSESVFESAFATQSQAVFDSSNEKIVIAYEDHGNSNYGTAVVGTVSGTSISFGTPAVFESADISAQVGIRAVFDSSNNKVVILYADAGNSNYGTAIVGTVSGTSISFGSAALFESASSQWLGATFDSSNNKVVVVYRDDGNSYYGTAAVGTVSGTSISFGTPVVFESATSEKNTATFDSSNNKVVIVYQDQGNSNYGTAIVGTVSGTSISFGSAAVFESAEVDKMSATFDTNVNKVIISYRDNGNSNYGTVISGTVSGTSISFDTPIVFQSDTVGTLIGSAFDSNVNRVVISTRRNSDSYGTATVYRTGGVVSSLTTENYIGIANSCSFHGNTETITVTVAGGIFYLDGVANPVIQLLKGHTYIFDQADNTNDGHPLHFKDSGGSQYTTGVTVTGTAGTSGAKVTIVIASDATEPTRYYCTVHGNGMGNTINLSDSFVNVDVIGTVNDQQSSLTAGQQYFVQTDGTLGETADSPSVFAGTAISATELVVKE